MLIEIQIIDLDFSLLAPDCASCSVLSSFRLLSWPSTSKMSSMSSIRVSGDKIEIINQLLLPHTTEYIEINTIQQAHDAIKSMKVSRTKVYYCYLPNQNFISHRFAAHPLSHL